MGYPVLELEREADPQGEWISYGVRMMLDLAGIKISLDDWGQLPSTTRDELTGLQAETDDEIRFFLERIESALSQAGLARQPLSEAKRAASSVWRDGAQPDRATAQLLADLGVHQLWGQLDRFGRYLACTFAGKQDLERARSALSELGYISS